MVGLGTQALTTYLVLVMAGRALGPAGFAALSSLYFLVTSVATGLFTPLEQEVTRRRGVERARHSWDRTLTRRALDPRAGRRRAWRWGWRWRPTR